MYKAVYTTPNAPEMPKGYDAYKAWRAEYQQEIITDDRDHAISTCRDAFHTGAEGAQVFGPQGVEFSIYHSNRCEIIEAERVDHAPELVCNECGAHVEMNHTGCCPQCNTTGMFQVYTSRTEYREVVNG